jgi:hypothetical protein
LAGVETADQCSEREALEGLRWVLARIRNHGIEGRPKRLGEKRAAGRGEDGEYREAEYDYLPCPTTPVAIGFALSELGAGSVEAGVKLAALHPMLAEVAGNEAGSMGLTLAAIDKFEARWVAAWRRSNR